MKLVKKVIHSIPGRTRLQLNKTDLKQAEIESFFRSIPGIDAAVFSDTTKTVIVYHQSVALSGYAIGYINRYFQEIGYKVEDSDRYTSVRDLSLVFAAYIGEKAGVKQLFTVTPFSYLTPSAIATLYACRHIIKNGLKTVWKPNPDTLTSVAVIASVLKGTPRSALVIYVMSAISEGLSEYTMNRTRSYVRNMMKIDASYAWLITESGQREKVKAETVRVGDRIMVFQGEKIPFDGTVENYHAHVDQSAITGEYMPVQVGESDTVYGGSIVTEGKIIIRVDRVGADLTVNRMIKLIEEAQDKQANIQMASEKFTSAMVPVSLSLAAFIYLYTHNWEKVLNMLVIDYVCGVKLSTATAISATIGKAAKKGVLLKGGQTIETLSKIDTLILDKTGTITEGRPVVTKIIPFNGYTEEEILAYSASAEEHSSHPIAEAIRSKATEKNVPMMKYDDGSLMNVVGKGVKVIIDDEEVCVGSIGFMEENQIPLNTNSEVGIFVAKDTTLIGILIIEDQIRNGMNIMIRRLRKAGVREIIMLTGDYEDTAKQVARSISLDHYVSEALPEDKVSYVKTLKEVRNRKIMMVGDGINDAPALAYADIGVTMGSKKTDIAMETADVVIHSENPLLLADLVEQSQGTMKIIKQNLVSSLLINTGAILLGTFGIIKPVTGAVIHNSSTLALVLNSAKLLLSGGRDEWKKN